MLALLPQYFGFIILSFRIESQGRSCGSQKVFSIMVLIWLIAKFVLLDLCMIGLNLYAGWRDSTNSKISRPYFVDASIGSGMLVRNFAGSGICTSRDGFQATTANLGYPRGVWKNTVGNLYISTIFLQKIRVISATGIITNLIGASGKIGGDFGENIRVSSAAVGTIQSFSGDLAGNVYFSEYTTHRVRKITNEGIIVTVAGSNGENGYFGENGPASSALLYQPVGIHFDNTTNTLYIVDSWNHIVRKVDLKTNIIFRVIGLGGVPGFSNSSVIDDIRLRYPRSIWMNEMEQKLYLADTSNYVIREVNLNTSSTRIIFGSSLYGTNYRTTTISYDGISYTLSNSINSISGDGNGNIYGCTTNRFIFKLNTILPSISLMAGFSGWAVGYMYSLFYDKTLSLLYFTESEFQRVRAIKLYGNGTTKIISVAGTGTMCKFLDSSSSSSLTDIQPFGIWKNDSSQEIIFTSADEDTVYTMTSDSMISRIA